ncbi:SRPBCC family protein [Cupriavidus basilensis]|uniref:SRPBCC family protein n=1 Tax=Cupriavidus basilensis TaxID=68895 RepID=A0ABT6B1C5_9BURK|nr:SRPBCC family protein [Cupriavidus basilensis]MDF3838658.1 SRPBCC family protein [Cupriavidus basilensis]
MKTRRSLLAALLALACAAAILLLPLPAQWRDVTRIVNVAAIARPDTVVFDYVSTPANWPVWHRSSLAVAGAVDHSLLPGEQVTETFLVAGRRGTVVWTVVERERPVAWTIEGTIDGRQAGTVRYTLTPMRMGTLFEREFVYTAPNLFFALTNRLLLRQRIEAESAEAVSRLRATLEGQLAAPL